MVKFRTINGSNNHPEDLGKTESRLIRLLDPAFEDGYSLPRGITENQPNNPFIGPSRLPNPRKISNAISAQSKSVPNYLNASDWIWQWGQFLDHDLDLNEGSQEPFFIPVDPNDPLASGLPRISGSEANLSTSSVNGLDVSNLNSQQVILPFLGNTAGGELIPFDGIVSSAQANEIGIAQIDSDTQRQAVGTPFIPLTRVTPAPGTGVPGKPRQYINEITTFIDGSQVYGSEDERAEFLRADNGKLKSQNINGEELLPYNTAGFQNAGGDDREDLFIAGDVRANEQIGLTAAHTLFVREHNSLAEDIARRIEAGDRKVLNLLKKSGLEESEFIYESARKVIGAQIQQITYSEYLPLLIGKNLIDDYSGYNPKVDPRISNEFANVSFRLGHSQLSPELQRVNPDGSSDGSIALGDAFFTPQTVINDGADSLLVGLTAQEAQAVDNLVVDGVRNFLFPAGTGGFDLAAVNIQRGRDVGLPSYNNARRGLGLKPVKAFLTTDRQLGITSDPEVAARFASIYDSVEDVDFWIGGISEDPVNGGLVGQLFNKVLTNQFTRLRDGDRFFYLNDLDELRVLDPDFETTKLSDILEDNTNENYVFSNNVFIVPGLTVDSLNSEEGSPLEFVVSLSDVSSAQVTVDFQTIDGTATAGEDYIKTSGTLTFNPGETTKTISVNLLDDSVLNDNETVLLKLSNASNKNIEDNLAVSRPIFDREIIGNSKNNRLNGSFGNDNIKGLGGKDKISGGFGNDFLDGGEGNDTLNGDSNFNRGSNRGDRNGNFNLSEVGDINTKNLSTKLGSNDFNRGNSSRLSSNDTQLGGDGDDTLNGGFGNDTQLGGDGNDILNGDFDFGSDRQYKGNFDFSDRNNRFNSDFGDKNKKIKDDNLSNLVKGGNKNRFGSSFFGSDDIQFGGNGNDTLNGGFGSDRLTGVGNNLGFGEIDRLTGGFGKDTFYLGDENHVFYHGKGIFDYALITDFRASQDTIVLHGQKSDYVLATIEDADLPKGIGLYLDRDDSYDLTPQVDDLIAVVTQNIANLDRGFTFV